MSTLSLHIPVLLEEVLEALQVKIRQGARYLDCTFGGGGHSQAILESQTSHQVFAHDQDSDAIQRGAVLLNKFPNSLQLSQASFEELSELYLKSQKPLTFDGILADLGFSSDQLEAGRGFSFSKDEPLDMRMDQRQPLTAADLLNELDLSELCKIFREGGLQAEARILAKAILKARPLKTTKDLLTLLQSLRIRRLQEKKTNPATLIFQALRIAVNREFIQLDQLLNFIPKVSKPSARVAIISFHSLEDQRVARTMRDWQGNESGPANWAGAREKITASKGRLITKKAIVPAEDELQRNPRSRSARLRVFEFAESYQASF